MTLNELGILLKFLIEHYDPKFYILVAMQFCLGLRASEALAIQIWDFKDQYRYLDYRQAKTNKMVYNEPVPEPLRQLVIAYIVQNRHRLIDGHLFGKYTGRGSVMTTETYGTLWTKWRRAIGEEYPRFLDKYKLECGQERYRISSHSLRRLHRTVLWKNIKDYKIVMELCHYSDYSSFERYINEFELMDKKDDYLLSNINPVLQAVTMFSEGQRQLRGY